MTAYDNIITTEDTVASLDQEFVKAFRGEYDRFAEILGLFPVQTRAAGSALYQYKITGQLADQAKDDQAPEKGSSGKTYEEGDFIARTKFVLDKEPVGEIEFAPYAKQTTAQAILKGGFENAVLRTDRKALQQLRSAILADFFAFLGQGTGSATGVGMQGALAQMDAVLANSMETNGDEPGAIVHFVNRLDAADYLGKAPVTMQTVFGLTYLESFLGVENVILTNKVAKGTAIATPVENIHIYGLDFGALGSAGLSYESEELGLVGVHHAADYDYASAETYIVRGATFLPEVKDYIVVGTVAASA